MAWPTVTDFIEAVQNLRGCASDEELRGGEVARTPLGLPMLWSGNFADVFKINCPATGNTWALKCFTREVAGQRDRYRRIATHLEWAQLPFTVDFQYLEQGLRVGGQWFPALKMRWVEGLTLAEFVEAHLDRPGNLRMLLDLWMKLAIRLREAEVAHADLQHGNVLLVPMSGGALALRLIDYDGMYVPSLAGTQSGEVGHPAYQHPQRLREGTYNAEVDRFSHLSIYCGILCLMRKGRDLWQRFNNGDNLLFREVDFRDPARSDLFRALWNDPFDADIRRLVGRVILACQSRLEETSLLAEVVADEKVLPLTFEQEAAINAILTPGHHAHSGADVALAVPPGMASDSKVQGQGLWWVARGESDPLRSGAVFPNPADRATIRAAGASETFDPYYEWLGIPPSEQPPHHYRLLGITPLEDSATVIENAADQRMGHLRTFQTGKYPAESQRLLNDVAAARICLLSPEKKTAYDQWLRQRLAPVVVVDKRTLPPPLPPPPPLPAPPPRISAAGSRQANRFAADSLQRGPPLVFETSATGPSRTVSAVRAPTSRRKRALRIGSAGLVLVRRRLGHLRRRLLAEESRKIGYFMVGYFSWAFFFTLLGCLTLPRPYREFSRPAGICPIAPQPVEVGRTLRRAESAAPLEIPPYWRGKAGGRDLDD